MSVVYSHRVRYHEVDQQGYLFNGRYLEIADVAMVEFFRSLGFQYDALIAGGTDPSLVKTEVTFSAPAHFDDLLDADVSASKVGTSSFHIQFVLRRGDDTVATIQTTYVNVDPAIGRSRPLPDDVAAALRAASSPTGA